MAREHADQFEFDDGDSSAFTESPQTGLKESPNPNKVDFLPQYKVLLHNDEVNDVEHVVLSILKVTTLSLADAKEKMWEAHCTGVSLLLVTHRERAELYIDQFRTYGLTVTIEPAD